MTVRAAQAAFYPSACVEDAWETNLLVDCALARVRRLAVLRPVFATCKIHGDCSRNPTRHSAWLRAKARASSAVAKQRRTRTPGSAQQMTYNPGRHSPHMTTHARPTRMGWVIFVAGAILSWGAYGALLHQGQVQLGNPLKALLCVGVAYFLIGVIVPNG